MDESMEGTSMTTREDYIAGAKSNSLYWAERACEAGSEGLMYTMLIQWAMGDELFGEHWDNWKRKQA
jgi:hypothetical protein